MRTQHKGREANSLGEKSGVRTSPGSRLKLIFRAKLDDSRRGSAHKRRHPAEVGTAEGGPVRHERIVEHLIRALKRRADRAAALGRSTALSAETVDNTEPCQGNAEFRRQDADTTRMKPGVLMPRPFTPPLHAF